MNEEKFTELFSNGLIEVHCDLFNCLRIYHCVMRGNEQFVEYYLNGVSYPSGLTVHDLYWYVTNADPYKIHYLSDSTDCHE